MRRRYREGSKVKGGWSPRGRKTDKNLSNYDDSRDAYWTKVADEFLKKKSKKVKK